MKSGLRGQGYEVRAMGLVLWRKCYEVRVMGLGLWS